MATPQTQTATVTKPAQRDSRVPLPPTWVTLPILVVLGYVALLVVGYALIIPRGDALQPLPLYVYLGILLLALQGDISVNKSGGRIVYLFLTSGFALAYAGSAVFFTAADFTRSPYTYIILTVLLLAVFVYDAIDRRRAHPMGLGATPPEEESPRLPRFSFQSFGSDFAALAVLFFVVWALQDTLGPQSLLQALHLKDLLNGVIPPNHATVDLNAALGLHLDPSISLLQSIDLLIALAATAIALLLLGIVGVLSIASQQPPSTDATRESPSVTAFGRNLRSIIQSALDHVLLSLRLVLGPLVWLIPAFSIAAFAQRVTEYLNTSYAEPTTNILVLFSPLSKAARDGIATGIADIVLGAVAVSTVILAVTVVEHNAKVIRDTLRVLRLAGRTIALTLAFFIYSLAALNAVVILAPPHYDHAPFQVGTAGLAALLVALGFAVAGIVAARLAADGRVPPREEF